MDERLFRNIAGNPGLIRRRRQLLEKLAANTENPALADMARDLMSGRLTPRQAMANTAYSEALAPGVEKFTAWYSRLSENEKADLARTGQQRLDELAREELGVTSNPPAAVRPVRPVRRPALEDDQEDYSTRTWAE